MEFGAQVTARVATGSERHFEAASAVVDFGKTLTQYVQLKKAH